MWSEVVAGCDKSDSVQPPPHLDLNVSCHEAWSAGSSLFLSQTCGTVEIYLFLTSLISFIHI